MISPPSPIAGTNQKAPAMMEMVHGSTTARARTVVPISYL